MAKKTDKVDPKPRAVYVQLTRLDSTNNALRTQTAKGYAQLPKKGEPFVLFGESLSDPGNGFRLITTSTVMAITDDLGTLVFSTRNSHYKLELLPDEEDE